MPKYKDDSEESTSSSEEEVGDEESAYEPDDGGDNSPSSEDSGDNAFVPDEESEEQDDDENSEAGEKDIDNDGEDIIAIDSDEDEDGDDDKPQKKKAPSRTKKEPSTTFGFATKTEEEEAIAAAKETIKADPTRVPKLKPVTKKLPYKKKEKKFVIDEEELKKPTWTRKTDNGGYAHTSRSRSKISAANSGNVAWNAGKNWSNSVRTKIALGVQARNRVVLLEKLKRLHMTEEEWFDMKRKIKLKRERVRVIKRRNTNLQPRVVQAEKAQRKRQEEYRQSIRDAKEQEWKAAASTESDIHTGKVSKKVARAAIANRLADEAKNVFVREIEWKPFEWKREGESGSSTTMMEEDGKGDNDKDTGDGKDEDRTKEIDNTQNGAADQAVEGIGERADESDAEFWSSCPDGGPGGLVCCESCSNKYSMFLSQTDKDLESQRVRNTSREMKRLMDIISNKQTDLENTLKKARAEMPGRSAQHSFVSRSSHQPSKAQAIIPGGQSAEIMTNPMDIEAIDTDGMV